MDISGTKFINLAAGPGTGKSTTAAGLFYRLKSMGINAELVTEYAKDRVWSEDFKTLGLQPYMSGKQLMRQYKLLGNVEVAVTDSPIIFSLLYKGFGCVDGFDEVIVKQFNLFNNVTFLLKRDPLEHPYNPKGRTQTESEAIILDQQIIEVLDRYDIPYHEIAVKKDGSHLDDILRIAGY